MTRSTSAVAFCCSSASSRSRRSCAVRSSQRRSGAHAAAAGADRRRGFGLRRPTSLRGLAFDVDRQREQEGRALAQLGFDPQPAAVHLDDLLGDRQAETGAALLLGGRGIGLLEFLENLGLIGRGDAGAVVVHRQP